MNKYIKPKMKLVEFDFSDIVTASPCSADTPGPTPPFNSRECPDHVFDPF